MEGIKLGHFFSRARCSGIKTESVEHYLPYKDQTVYYFRPRRFAATCEILGQQKEKYSTGLMNLVSFGITKPYSAFIAIGPGIFATRKEC